MRNEKGFTITELLVAIAVGAIASVLIVTAFIFTYGSVLVEQTRADMVLNSQLFLRRMSDDIRVANEIRATNQISDSYQSGGWVTSDPANILIFTQPVTDDDDNLVYDDVTGYPYQNEIVYFGDNNKMYRRTLANSLATGNSAVSTCPSGTSGCPQDVELVGYLDNMLFEFYDVDDNVTTDPTQARSMQITINLFRNVYGNDITTTNTTRVTLRNEN